MSRALVLIFNFVSPSEVHISVFLSECADATLMFVVSLRNDAASTDTMSQYFLFPSPPFTSLNEPTYFLLQNCPLLFFYSSSKLNYDLFPISCYLKDNNTALPVTLETAATFEMTIAQSL